MARKLKHLFLCLSICLSIGTLAPLTLRAMARSRAPTGGRVSDQALAGSPARSDSDQAGMDLLTTTHTISQPPPLYPLRPSSARQPLESPAFTVQTVEFDPQYEALLVPISPISTSYAAITERYLAVMPRFLAEESSHIVLSDKNCDIRPIGSLTNDSIRTQSTCTVTSTADSGPSTLRDCLENTHIGDTITFNTTFFPSASPATISLLSTLPVIITDDLTIDASGAGVILDGSRLSSGPGLLVNGASGVRIRGLQIVSFPWDGIALINGASNSVIEGNFIGTNASGTRGLGNLRNGIFIGLGASNNIVGGDTPGVSNLISDNEGAGIWLQDVGTTGNQIQGNVIGTDISGTTALGNLLPGVFIGLGASDNLIGGVTPGTGNLISGNEDHGIKLQNANTTGNLIQGNFVGTDISGTAPLGNLQIGVLIGFGASDNTVGGSTSGARNLISSNASDGIRLQNAGTTGNQIQGNFIGTDISGTAVLGNLQDGVSILGASDNLVGGNRFAGGGSLGHGNLISGNQYQGIRLQDPGATRNQVQGNFIGTDVSGTAALGNLETGILVTYGASDNVIGGNRLIGDDPLGQGNLISGNGKMGIQIQNEDTDDNQVQGNFIGTDVSGTAALGNYYAGIVILEGGSNNLIGGQSLSDGNLISGNGTGIVFVNTGASNNQVQGNFIGTDASGTEALGNVEDGITLVAGASNNLIGGDRFTGDGPMGQGNLISGNQDDGIQLQDADTTGNQVQGNFIGTDVSGSAALGNLDRGIVVNLGASNNLIGGETLSQGNLISSNKYDGILLLDIDTSSNWVQGNRIGTDVSGTAALGNLDDGVAISLRASNNLIGGNTIAAGNIIAFNHGNGVRVDGGQTLGNTVSHNSIHDNDGLGIENINGGNTELSPPTIMEVITGSVSGRTQPGYIVEVFSDNNREGRWFEGSVTANGSGVFTLTHPGVFSGFNLTATDIDADGNTSEFSTFFPIGPRVFLPLIMKGSE